MLRDSCEPPLAFIVQLVPEWVEVQYGPICGCLFSVVRNGEFRVDVLKQAGVASSIRAGVDQRDSRPCFAATSYAPNTCCVDLTSGST